MAQEKWMYVFVRKDLPSKQYIAVQAAHATYELGKVSHHKSPNLVLLGVKDLKELNKARKRIERELPNRKVICFLETDLPKKKQFTAFAVEPVGQADRLVFRQYSLLSLEEPVKETWLSKLLKKLKSPRS